MSEDHTTTHTHHTQHATQHNTTTHTQHTQHATRNTTDNTTHNTQKKEHLICPKSLTFRENVCLLWGWVNRKCINTELVLYGLSIATFLAIFHSIATVLFTKFSYFLASTLSLDIVFIFTFSVYENFDQGRQDVITASVVSEIKPMVKKKFRFKYAVF